MVMLKAVNESRLFKLLPYFFENPESVLIELAQNAQRSGATKLDIMIKEGVLSAVDNGRGTDNPTPLFVLADSDWEAEVEANQQPAGWGLFFLYSIARGVTFTSRFGEVKMDCEEYLHSEDYRAGMLGRVDKYRGAKGFSVEAFLTPETAGKLITDDPHGTYEGRLCWFPLDIMINGKAVKRKTAAGECKDYEIKGEYQGNKIYIKPKGLGLRNGRDSLRSDLDVLWYGIPIRGEVRYSSLDNIVIDVSCGTPLTPVLPYRHTVKSDEKLDSLLRFARDLIAQYCVKAINKAKGKPFDAGCNHPAFPYMRVLKELGTQAELNSLNKFYCKMTEPHYQPDYDIAETIKIIGKDDGPVVSEKLVIKGLDEKADDIDYEQVFLAEGQVTEAVLPAKKPDWLEVKEFEHVVEVKMLDEKPYAGSFLWHKVEFKSDLDISVIGVVEGWNGGDVYYSGDPDDVYGITDSIFARKFFSEDSDNDAWDTQRESFDESVRADLMKLKDSYPLSELLSGLSVIDIRPDDVVSISINRRKKTMTVETRKKGKATTKTVNVTI